MPGPRPPRKPRISTLPTASPSPTELIGYGASSPRTDALTNEDEGVLYTMKVAERPPDSQLRNRGIFRRGSDAPTTKDTAGENIEDGPAPQSLATHPVQYTISKMSVHESSWLSRICRSFGVELPGPDDATPHVYNPSMPIAKYVNWTFHASFSAVFLSFLFSFFTLCLIFACLLALTAKAAPGCLVVSGDPYGENQDSLFSDAFAMSWTTFTTVGYGNVYPATGKDLVGIQPATCTAIIFICTLESFLGLIYAGMGAAILFGKVNRVQSHAHLTFSNTVCLQYAEVDLDFVDEDSDDSDCKSDDGVATDEENDDEKTKTVVYRPGVRRGVRFKVPRKSFKEKFMGCPVLTFQVVNDFCNRDGYEIMDGLMKVVGVKHKHCGGKISHAQLVRVNLVTYENPCFAKIWHGTHILDGSSPLLTKVARHKIRANGGSWPDKWFGRVAQIRKKLDFENLIVTVAGVSNLSACAVYANKWYNLDDVVFGFDFAPLLSQNQQTGKLEVDLGLVNDVREQRKGSGEDLCEPPSGCGSTSFVYRGSSTIVTRHTMQA